MPGFKFKNYKPFECDIIESDSIIVKKVLINFGTVFCTASNSFTITQPTALTLTFNKKDVLCNGQWH